MKLGPGMLNKFLISILIQNLFPDTAVRHNHCLNAIKKSYVHLQCLTPLGTAITEIPFLLLDFLVDFLFLHPFDLFVQKYLKSVAFSKGKREIG